MSKGAYAPNYKPETSFVEIGKEIGVSAKHARVIYSRAIAKLRRYNPEKLKEMRQMARERQRLHREVEQ